MIQMSTGSAKPVAVLEIGGRRLPARMVASRVRADLPRRLPPGSLPARQRVRLAMLLVLVAIPLVAAGRRRKTA